MNSPSNLPSQELIALIDQISTDLSVFDAETDQECQHVPSHITLLLKKIPQPLNDAGWVFLSQMCKKISLKKNIRIQYQKDWMVNNNEEILPLSFQLILLSIFLLYPLDVDLKTEKVLGLGLKNLNAFFCFLSLNSEIKNHDSFETLEQIASDRLEELTAT